MTKAWIPNKVRREVAINSKGLCHHCGKKASKAVLDRWSIPKYYDENDISFEYDHLLSKADNGTNDLENIVISCRTCNRTKKRSTRSYEYDITKIINDING